MSHLESVANKVVLNYKNGDKEAAFDPSMIFTVMEIITNLIGMFKNCKKTPSEAVKSMKEPNGWETLALRRAVRKELGGFKAMRREGDNLLNATLKTGKEISVEEVKSLYEEVDN